jgi:hypothetical protein
VRPVSADCVTTTEEEESLILCSCARSVDVYVSPPALTPGAESGKPVAIHANASPLVNISQIRLSANVAGGGGACAVRSKLREL